VDSPNRAKAERISSSDSKDAVMLLIMPFVANDPVLSEPLKAYQSINASTRAFPCLLHTSDIMICSPFFRISLVDCDKDPV
jgi:hypothetical protein